MARLDASIKSGVQMHFCALSCVSQAAGAGVPLGSATPVSGWIRPWRFAGFAGLYKMLKLPVVPIALDVPVKTVIHLDQTVAVDTRVQTRVLGVPLTLPIKAQVPIQADVPVELVNGDAAEGEFLLRLSLRELLAQLDPGQFWQIHRAVVINLAHVARVERRLTGLEGLLKGSDTRLPVSQSFQSRFKPM